MAKAVSRYKNVSAFTAKVLAATEKIPAGNVTTYAALARAVGAPRAARAVGNALNKNPFAPAVPCHRVISSSGELGGYGLGPKVKLAILKNEGVTFDEAGKINDFNLIIEYLWLIGRWFFFGC